MSREDELHSQKPFLGIGEVARLANVTERSVRYYEQVGVLPAAPRTATGARRFTPHYVCYIEGVLALQQVGLSLAEIAELEQLAQGCATPPGPGVMEGTGLRKRLLQQVRLLSRIVRVLDDRRGHAAPGDLLADIARITAGGDDRGGEAGTWSPAVLNGPGPPTSQARVSTAGKVS